MAISSWGQYDTSGLQKESQGANYSGSNNGYAIYTNGQSGVSYDQVNSLYKQLISKDQEYADPNSLAIWAVTMGLRPNFGEPQYLKDAFTTGKSSTGKLRGMDEAGLAYAAGKLGLTVDQIKKNQQAFLNGNDAAFTTPSTVLQNLPEIEAAKIKALQDYSASIEAKKQGVVTNPQDAQTVMQNTGSNQSGVQSNSSNQPVNNIQGALDVINNSGLDEGTKALFRQVVNNWDPDSEINTDNIIKEFNNIKQTTIDPYFQEQSNIIIDDVKRAASTAQTERERQLEVEQSNAEQNISNAQNSLEARGMTFSGQGVEQLGAKSAYAQEGTPEAQKSAMPVQTPFGGKFTEGLVNQSNRLISAASRDAFQQNLTNLSRQAEQQLGSAQSKGLVSGVDQMGNITGALPQQKTQAEASALSSVAEQERMNQQARQPLKVL